MSNRRIKTLGYRIWAKLECLLRPGLEVAVPFRHSIMSFGDSPCMKEVKDKLVIYQRGPLSPS